MFLHLHKSWRGYSLSLSVCVSVCVCVCVSGSDWEQNSSRLDMPFVDLYFLLISSQCVKQPFSKKLRSNRFIRSAGIMFTSRVGHTHTRTHTHTHTHTNCSENITPSRFCRGVKINKKYLFLNYVLRFTWRCLCSLNDFYFSHSYIADFEL